MNAFIQLYVNHPTIAPLITYMAASAAIGSMPAPLSTSSMFYVWLFKFLNTFAANFSRAFSSKLGIGETNGQTKNPNSTTTPGTPTP